MAPGGLGEDHGTKCRSPRAGGATPQGVTSKMPGLVQPDLPPRSKWSHQAPCHAKAALTPGEDVGSSRKDQRSTLGREGTVQARPGSTRPPCGQRVSCARWRGAVQELIQVTLVGIEPMARRTPSGIMVTP